jgi:VanZ family protein
MNRKINIIFSWTAVLLWLVLIFYLSSQPAVESDGLSRKVTEIIIEKVGTVMPLDNETSTTVDLVAKFNHMVRKSAHFSIYFVLGLLVMNALSISGVIGFKGLLFSLLFCIFYAISDVTRGTVLPVLVQGDCPFGFRY